MATLATIYTALSDLSLSGVTNLDEPPIALETAILPCKWVDSVGIDESPLHRGSMGGDRKHKARIVVVTDALGQDTQGARWAVALAMADTLNAGIKTLGATIGYTTTWTLTVEPMFQNYLGVMAVLEMGDIG